MIRLSWRVGLSPNFHSPLFAAANDADTSFTVTLDYLSIVLIGASMLYCLCLATARKRFLDQSSRGNTAAGLAPLFAVSSSSNNTVGDDDGLGPKRLLLWSIALVCTCRIMTFWGVAAMDISNVRAHYPLKPVDWHGSRGSDPVDKNQHFYDAAMTVLFDLPNAIFVSIYVLLSLVWTESFLAAKFINRSTYLWKRRCLLIFAVLNFLLYSTQLVLYILIVATNSSGVARTILYVTTPLLNAIAALFVLLTYIFSHTKFSGFPFRSAEAKGKVQKISRILVLWSITRLFWGLGMIYVFVENIELLQDSQTPFLLATALLLMLLLCEIAPIFVLLNYFYSDVMELENIANNDMSALALGNYDVLREEHSAEHVESFDQNGAVAFGDLFGREFATAEGSEPLLGPSR